jgi:high-affinity iron transporter
MIFGFKRLVGALLCLAAALVVPRAAHAETGDPPEVEAQRLIHVLDYVGADYGGAVSNGAVSNADEYAEQQSLLADAAKIGAAIAPAVPAGGALDLPTSLAHIRRLVDDKAPEEQVARATSELRAQIGGTFKLAEAPARISDRERGRALYREHCATCHGETGLADTTRAAGLTPRPANFLDPDVGERLTAGRVVNTVRFGVNGTAMVPFTFLDESARWDLAFFVTGLRHRDARVASTPTFSLGELASRSDASLREDLRAAGVATADVEPMLAHLRLHAPFEVREPGDALPLARTKLHRAKAAIAGGDYDAARGLVLDAYLEGIEPSEGALLAADPALVAKLEQRIVSLRGQIAERAPAAEVTASIDAALADLTHAAALTSGEPASFVSTALSSAGIVLREGVEAALLIAALLGIAVQAGLGHRKRLVHAGWISALVAGVATWLLARFVVEISGARRELIEGLTALAATAVLFYVSYSLLAKREVARWMKFLRSQVTARRAGLSLFGVAFLAAYREAFETVLFYQTLLSQNASPSAAIGGAAAGGVVLVVVVLAYSRAGRFVPPQVFFQISSYLLYALAVVFVGQGLAALQMVGVVPAHPVPLPSVPALGLYPTLETCTAQLTLVVAAVVGAVLARRPPVDPPASPRAVPLGAAPAPRE